MFSAKALQQLTLGTVLKQLVSSSSGTFLRWGGPEMWAGREPRELLQLLQKMLWKQKSIKLPGASLGTLLSETQAFWERGVCLGFSCGLLREWPVGTDLSQACRCLVGDGGLPPACLWARQFCNWSWAWCEHSGLGGEGHTAWPLSDLLMSSVAVFLGTGSAFSILAPSIWPHGGPWDDVRVPT